MTKKIAIIGYGYVGKAVTNFFKDHFDIVVYDPFTSSIISNTKDEINTADLAVICVPTPMSDTGECDTSFVESTLQWLKTPLVLVKSTIPPKTTKTLSEKYDMDICFSPEYIGEGKYEVPVGKGYPDPHDMKKHEFVIIGGSVEPRQKIIEFFKTVLGAEARYFLTDSTTAELCKYMENSFLATKVTFCNEFFEVAKTLGVNYDELREMWLADGRIGRSHTAVFADKRGFSGKCLPKDVNAIVHCSNSNGYTPKLLQSVLEVNKQFVK